MSRPVTGYLWACVFVVLSIGELAAQPVGTSGNAEARKLKNPVQATPRSIALGKELYSKNCRSCHGADAKGDGPMKPKDSQPADLTDGAWARGGSDGEIYAVLRDGTGPGRAMRGYKSRMTDQELWSIVNFLRSLGDRATR